MQESTPIGRLTRSALSADRFLFSGAVVGDSHQSSCLSLSLSLSLSSARVINAGKSMLNEDQASCEKLFVKKLSGKHKNNATLQEDNGVRLRDAELKTECHH